jgi:hypothetical protein
VSKAAQKLLALMLLDVRRLMAALESGTESVAQWQQAFSDALAKYHTAALLVGQSSTQLSDPARKWLGKTVAAQIKYLNNFAVEIQDAEQFKPGWNARAALYAQGIGQSYWRGATKMLPLPAMPRDGTSQCLGNCTCSWEITELDGEGNYDCYWRLGAAERHCQTCPTRAGDWAPYQIRDGRAQ